MDELTSLECQRVNNLKKLNFGNKSREVFDRGRKWQEVKLMGVELYQFIDFEKDFSLWIIFTDKSRSNFCLKNYNTSKIKEAFDKIGAKAFIQELEKVFTIKNNYIDLDLRRSKSREFKHIIKLSSY